MWKNYQSQFDFQPVVTNYIRFYGLHGRRCFVSFSTHSFTSDPVIIRIKTVRVTSSGIFKKGLRLAPCSEI